MKNALIRKWRMHLLCDCHRMDDQSHPIRHSLDSFLREQYIARVTRIWPVFYTHSEQTELKDTIFHQTYI